MWDGGDCGRSESFGRERSNDTKRPMSVGLFQAYIRKKCNFDQCSERRQHAGGTLAMTQEQARIL